MNNVRKGFSAGAGLVWVLAAACSSGTTGGGGASDASTDSALTAPDAEQPFDSGGTSDSGKPLADAAKDSPTDGPVLPDASDGGAQSDASDAAADVAPDNFVAPFTLQTSAFNQGASIPAVHACNTHASPALTWTAGPAGTQSYAVVMIDKTRAGTNDEVHWVLFDIPGATLSLGQGVLRNADLQSPVGAKQVLSFDGLPGYFGPCPPVGDAAHTYEWRVYAIPSATLATVTTATGKQTAAANVAQAAIGMTNAVSGTYAR